MPTPRQSSLEETPKYIGIVGLAGRNGSDPTFLIPDDQCLEAVNVDWYRSSFGRKRGGATAVSLATTGTAFASGVLALGRHLPAATPSAAEFWAVDGAREFHRLAGSATWASPTVLDACTASPQEAVFQSFHGKYYVAYDSAVNRLHCWDGSTLRRVGMAAPAAPTVVESGGTVTDTRKYRVSWTKQVAGVTTYRSNLGTATAVATLIAELATVTRPTAPGEGETHWELWASTTPYADYRRVATTILATTTAIDDAALSTTAAPDEGANTPPPSAKYIVADDGRIIMAGCYETAAGDAIEPSHNRVWWTSILGAGTGDDERVSNTGTINNYADLEEAITGLSQPMQTTMGGGSSLERGTFYVFSLDSQWKFVATGTATAPYLKFRITGGGGCLHHKSIVTAIDSNGNPAIYWMSPYGPYRIGSDGQMFIGEDVTDIMDTVNLDAMIPCHSVYHAAKRQVWFYVATGSSLYPDTKMVFDTRLGRVTEVSGVRKGWSLHYGESAKAYCSCMYSETVGATMSRKLKPHVGYTEATKIWQCDTTATDDDGSTYQAYVDVKSYAPWGLGRKGGSSDAPVLVADPAPGVTIRITSYRNEGGEQSFADASLTDYSDSGDADKVFALCEDAKFSDSYTFRARIGDAAAISNSWNIHAVLVPVVFQGDH